MKIGVYLHHPHPSFTGRIVATNAAEVKAATATEANDRQYDARAVTQETVNADKTNDALQTSASAVLETLAPGDTVSVATIVSGAVVDAASAGHS